MKAAIYFGLSDYSLEADGTVANILFAHVKLILNGYANSFK